MRDRGHALIELQRWLFVRMIKLLSDKRWKVRVRDFSKSKKKRLRDAWGLTIRKRKTIYLHPRFGTVRVLVHEFGHVIFNGIFESEALAFVDRYPSPTPEQTVGYFELNAALFERWFFRSMTRKQRKAFQKIIEGARKRYAQHKRP
jgi:hypothetical protein